MIPKTILAEINRRNLLKYLGNAAVALPFMRTLFETQAFGANTAKRAVFFFYPDGILYNHWHPSQTGTSFVLPAMTAPLNRVRGDIVMIKGSNYHLPQGNHAGGVAYCLTGLPGIPGPGISIDSYLGSKFSKGVKIDVLRLGVCTLASSENYKISWNAKGSANDININPRLAFAQVFGPVSKTSLALDKSVIDIALADLKALQNRLGSIEKDKLDSHMTSLRELERRVANSVGAGDGGLCGRGVAIDKFTVEEKDLRGAGKFVEVAAIQREIGIQALACGATNVLVFQMAQSIAWNMWMAAPGLIGISENHHELSHLKKGEEPFTRSQAFFVDQFAKLLEGMKAVKEGDQSLLYNSVAMAFSDLGHSLGHNVENVGVVLAGQAGGRIKTGRAIEQKGANHAETLVAVLQAMGLPDTQFGTGKRPLPGILS